LNNLLRRHQETSVTTPEILHCQERGVSLLNQYIIIFKATNPLCTPFNIILQDLTNATKPAPLLYSTTHENIRIERLASDIFCSIRRTGFSYDSRQQYESPGQFIPPLPVFPRKYMKSELMNDTRPGSIHAWHPSEWIPKEIFSQWFLHFIKQTKPTKNILLSRYWTGTGGYYFCSRESCWHHLPPTSQQSQNVPLDKSFMKPLKICYSQETEIYIQSNLRRASHHLLPNWRTFRQCIQASCNKKDSG